MKKIIILLIILTSFLGYSQQASRTNNATNIKQYVHDPSTIMGCLPPLEGTFQIYEKDSIQWEIYNINGFNPAVILIGDARYIKTEVDPVWLAEKGNYFTKAASDARFLQSYTETDPLFNTKFSTKTTTDLIEGTNLYFTAARFNSSLALKTTSDLSEGSNLYYTNTRFNTAFSSKTTTDLVEGVNLYYTASRFNIAFGGKTTSDLVEGVNLYYTNTRSRNAISLTTTGTPGSAPSYDNTTGIINIPPVATTPIRTFTIPTFTSSTTATQLSITKDSPVQYSYDGTVNISLLAGQSITVILEYADNAAMTTNLTLLDSTLVANSGVLGLTQINTLKVSGTVPAGKYRKVRFVLTGTGTVAPTILKAGQEYQL